MDGKNFLKVTGIIMIVGGALGIIMGIIAIAGMSLLLAIGATDMGLYTVGSILVLVSAVVELVAGIIGVKNCAKPEKAKTCIIFGLLVIVLCVAGVVVSAIASGTIPWTSLIVGLVLPALYLVGAFKNKQSINA